MFRCQQELLDQFMACSKLDVGCNDCEDCEKKKRQKKQKMSRRRSRFCLPPSNARDIINIHAVPSNQLIIYRRQHAPNNASLCTPQPRPNMMRPIAHSGSMCCMLFTPDISITIPAIIIIIIAGSHFTLDPTASTADEEDESRTA